MKKLIDALTLRVWLDMIDWLARWAILVGIVSWAIWTVWAR